MVLYVKAKLSTPYGKRIRVWRDGMQTDRLISRGKNLQAALDLIVNQGYYGTSIKGITARVGISKAVSYSYFKTKGESVLRLMEEYKTRFAEEVVRIKDEHQGHAVQGTRSNYTFVHTV
jgi:AcrR family transcriptional regulator